MKKLMISFLLILFMTGCGAFERGNYDKDRSGYVLSGDFIVNYHTNAIGEIDVFMIDQVMSYFEALEYTDFDFDSLTNETVLNSSVTESELVACGITSATEIPRFIRIEESTYYYHIRDNGYCTYDEYEFHKYGFTEEITYDVEEVSPVEDLNKTLFTKTDFHVNTFETIIFIENITYSTSKEEWEKEIVTVLPMSLKQAGNLYEDNSDYFEELTVLQLYVLQNQSINLLSLRDDYEDELVNNIWSEDTVDRLGRDHDVVKTVRNKRTGEILEIINDTLARLGMFS